MALSLQYPPDLTYHRSQGGKPPCFRPIGGLL
jgi:hypothetical protein